MLKIRTNSLVSSKSFYTPKGKKSAKDITGAIRNSLSILVVVDQKDSSGEEVLFFNKKVKTQTGFEPFFHNNVTISDNEMMEMIHYKIVKWIKSEPTQWFWQHKRIN